MNRFLLTALVIMSLPPYLVAQENSQRQTFRSQLTVNDPLDSVRKSGYAKVHTVTFEKNQVYLIDLKSQAFDTFLRLEDASGKQLAFNDDADPATGLDSRLGFAPTKTGKYRLIVTSFKNKQIGEYQLQVHKLDKSGPDQRLQSELTKADKQSPQKQYFKILNPPLNHGQAYQIDVTSKDIDPIAFIINPKGQIIVRDDDGGEGLNSRLVFVPNKGKYLLAVLAYQPNTVGAFQVKITSYDLPEEKSNFIPIQPDAVPLVVYGKLTKKDEFNSIGEGNYHKVHKITLKRGKAYGIDLQSGQFDTLLRLEDAKGKKINEDEDSGFGTNSWLMYAPVKEIDCRLVVTSSQKTQQGTYLLTVQEFANDKQAVSRHKQEIQNSIWTKKVYKLYLEGNKNAATTLVNKVYQVQKQLYPKALYKLGHPQYALTLNNMGFLQKSMGKIEKAMLYYTQALEMRQRLYGGGDHPDILVSLHNVAVLLEDNNEYEKALPFYNQELEMRRRMCNNQDHPKLAMNLNTVGNILSKMERHEKALPYYRKALEMQQRLYKDQDHPDLATGLNQVGYLHIKANEFNKVLPYYQKALEMRQRIYKDQDHPDLATSLNNMGYLYVNLGKYSKAAPYYKQALEMRQRIYKDQDHPDLATSLSNMGYLYRLLGKYDKALLLHTQALKISQRSYNKKQNSIDLAISLNNVGYLMARKGDSKNALGFFERALNVLLKRYQGQDNIVMAMCLSNISYMHQQQGKYQKARMYCNQSLEMRRRLNKNQDHVDVMQSHNNMGDIFFKMEQYEKALFHFNLALSMCQRLYKNLDHPHLIRQLNNTGFALQKIGKPKEALSYYVSSLKLQNRLVNRVVASHPIAEATYYFRTHSDVRSSILSISNRINNSNIYKSIWTSQAFLEQVFRHRNQLAQLKSTKAQKILELRELITNYELKRSGLLSQKVNPKRDQQLEKINALLKKAERKLIELLPRQDKWAQMELEELIKTMNEEEVFIDFYHYNDKFAPNDERCDKYVAFIVSSKNLPIRVELGNAAVLNQSISHWRSRIDEWKKSLRSQEQKELQKQAEEQAKILRNKLWKPIAQHIPANIKRIYISPTENLARLPFAALPDDHSGTVLLEKYAFALVPSGPFLLNHLQKLKTDSGELSGSLLAIGGVDYGKVDNGRWSELIFTESERKKILALWGSSQKQLYTASSHNATADWLLEHLSKVRYAHIATHGEYKYKDYLAEQKRLADESNRFRSGLRPNLQIGVDSGIEQYHKIIETTPRDPLSFVSLVLAGANEPNLDDRHKGYISGSTLANQNLSKMELAVLSACQSGLGKHQSGWGAKHLPLAFHVAGCKNVVSSLWNVDDKATAALMAVFYHELWENKKAPIDALRSAQLYMMRHPEAVDELSSDRGGPQDVEVILRTTAPPPVPGQRSTAVRPWLLPVGVGVLGLVLAVVAWRLRRIPATVRLLIAILVVGGCLYVGYALRPMPEPEPETPSSERLPPRYWAAFTLSGVGR